MQISFATVGNNKQWRPVEQSESLKTVMSANKPKMYAHMIVLILPIKDEHQQL